MDRTRSLLILMPTGILGVGALSCLWVLTATPAELEMTSRWYWLSLASLGVFLAGLIIGAFLPSGRRAPVFTGSAHPHDRTACDWDAELANLLDNRSR